MLRPLFLLLAASLAACSFASSDSYPEDAQATALAADLALLLDSAMAGAGQPPGAMLRVEAPALGLAWEKAAGVSERESGAPLRPDQPLRIASNTKSWVAAAILRLVEDGALELDADIEPHILEASRVVLRQGGYDPSRITLRMLLGHTSGLFDYASADVFFERLMSDPGHRWTRMEQLELAMSGGSAFGAPGERFRYSDTGYILLGEILEVRTGSPLPEAVRELVGHDRLGIRHSWFETLEPAPAGAPPMAHQYMEGFDITRMDASFDLYGGGGLVSNAKDMARLYRALLGGEIFRRPETLQAMLEPSPQSLAEGSAGYGLGMMRYLHGEIECYGHGGFWGTLAQHCPALDLTVVAAVTDITARGELRTMTGAAVRRVAEVLAGGGAPR